MNFVIEVREDGAEHTAIAFAKENGDPITSRVGRGETGPIAVFDLMAEMSQDFSLVSKPRVRYTDVNKVVAGWPKEAPMGPLSDFNYGSKGS